MHIKHSVLGKGDKKILFDIEMLLYYKQEFDELMKSGEYTFYFLERGQFTSLFSHDLLNRVSFSDLDKTYKKNSDLKDYYQSLLSFCREEKIKACVFTSTGQYWHPDFLNLLKREWITIALSTADDDTSAIKYCSLPYTKYYDYHFHVGVMYDKEGKTIADVLREHWWNPIWLPLWARADHINQDIRFDNRDIELCYIGNMNPPKFFRISKLKRHFGDRLKLYWAQGNGDWKSLKWIFYKICNKLFRFWYIQKLTEDELLEVYRRAKIWFNLHLVPYKWPSNSRMYELASNGVMQVCDNKLWMSRVFEDGKEIVCYESIDEAIEKIEYYLKNENERIEIAKAAYLRSKNEYTYLHVMKKTLDYICG